MEVVHLANSEDDLYSGYDDFKALANHDAQAWKGMDTLSTDEPLQRLGVDTGFGRNSSLLMSSKGRMTASRMGRKSSGTNSGGAARPMTAIRAVGYSSRGNRGQGTFDPLSMAAKHSGSRSILESREDAPQEKLHQLESKVNGLVEESCFALARKDAKLALEKAKEASQKERILSRQREQVGLADQPNYDLSFIVLFNLASQYEANEMHSEALNTYQMIMRNRAFQSAGRLKVNMGNIYVKLGHYSKAIKFYRMALDQVPNTHKRLRIKIMQNIGVLFVKMGKYGDAITSFEYIMGENPDFKTGLNLILCFYALGDKEKMKKSFRKMVETRMDMDDEERHAAVSLDNPQLEVLRDVIKGDSLKKAAQNKQQEAEWCILMGAKLISPIIDTTLAAGFAWCVDVIKESSYVDLAYELEINKAVTYLKQKEFAAAIEVLQSFERKKDAKVASAAATNLAFLCFLQNDIGQADKYADVALGADHYNPGALVNKGCCLYVQNNLTKARDYFKEALANDSTCTEAMFDLGLTLMLLGHDEDSFECFKKLHSVLPNQPNVIYNLAKLCERLNDKDLALEWYHQLLSLVPTDPSVLHKMGEIFEQQGDKQQAFQYHYDSYRYFPSKMEVAAWLGAYYINTEVYEKAIGYFARSALLQPTEVKWQLMVASCHRRSGNYQQALETYKSVHRKFPDNVECLRFLLRLSRDMGLQEAGEYAALLTKAEQLQETREQAKHRSSSSTSRASSRTSRMGSAGSTDLNDGGTGKTKDEAKSPSVQDFSYADPLGGQIQRPKTSAFGRNATSNDDFAHEELGDDLLPD